MLWREKAYVSEEESSSEERWGPLWSSYWGIWCWQVIHIIITINTAIITAILVIVVVILVTNHISIFKLNNHPPHIHTHA